MKFIFITLLVFCSAIRLKSDYLAIKSVSNIPERDSILQRETFLSGHQRFIAINVLGDNSNKNFYIKNENGDVIYKHLGESVFYFKVSDFNNDGFKDIIAESSGVDSGQQNLIIFDAHTKTFKLAGNCSNAKKINKTNYYYTYEDCCMGRNWSSRLFYISESKIIDIGLIKYSDGEGLYFLKLKGKREIKLKTLHVRINGDTPVNTGPHINFDLGYYWTKHWSMFVN